MSETEWQPSAEPGSLAIPGLAGAAGAVLGYRLGGVEGAATGAFAVPYLTAFLQNSAGQILGDRIRRVDAMLESAAQAAGLPPYDFAAKASRSERTRFLTEAAMKAAADTDWPPSVRAIGRALNAGLIESDDALIDIPKMVLPAMTNMTASHVQLLDLLVMCRWNWSASGPRFERIDEKPGLERTKSEWSEAEIVGALPALKPVLGALMGGLVRYDLVRSNDSTSEALAKYSQAYKTEADRTNSRLGRARETFRSPRLGAMEVDRIVGETTWSPTALGKQVLGYYDLAGQADEDVTDETPSEA
jgi:hypothetical protein